MLCFGVDSFGSYTIKIEKKGRIDECKREWKGEKVADLRVSFVRTSGLLSKLFSQNHPIQLHVDNTSSIQITANPVFHECTKHVFTFLNSYFD